MTDPAALIGMLGGAGAGAAYSFVRVLGKRGVNGKLIVMFFSAFTCVFEMCIRDRSGTILLPVFPE